MASSRDDFIIAIRSAFLKKSYQQKFSLLILLFNSMKLSSVDTVSVLRIVVVPSTIKWANEPEVAVIWVIGLSPPPIDDAKATPSAVTDIFAPAHSRNWKEF